MRLESGEEVAADTVISLPRLAGGVLPAAYGERRERWLAELTSR